MSLALTGPDRLSCALSIGSFHTRHVHFRFHQHFFIYQTPMTSNNHKPGTTYHTTHLTSLLRRAKPALGLRSRRRASNSSCDRFHPRIDGELLLPHFFTLVLTFLTPLSSSIPSSSCIEAAARVSINITAFDHSCRLRRRSSPASTHRCQTRYKLGSAAALSILGHVPMSISSQPMPTPPP